MERNLQSFNNNIVDPGAQKSTNSKIQGNSQQQKSPIPRTKSDFINVSSGGKDNIHLRSSSSSFQLPSDLDNDNISDKEVESFKQNYQNRETSSGNKNSGNHQNVIVPGLDLSIPNKIQQSSNRPQNQHIYSSLDDRNFLTSALPMGTFSETLMSPILSQDQDQDKRGDTPKNNTHKLDKVVTSGIQTLRDKDDQNSIKNAIQKIGAGSEQKVQGNRDNYPKNHSDSSKVYRKMETDKNAPQSILKNGYRQIQSPTRNPQSQYSQYGANNQNNQDARMAPISEQEYNAKGGQSLIKNSQGASDHKTQVTPPTNSKHQQFNDQEAKLKHYEKKSSNESKTQSSGTGSAGVAEQVKQPQNIKNTSQITNFVKNPSQQRDKVDLSYGSRINSKTPGLQAKQNSLNNHQRGPSMQSNLGPELTLDDDSYERDRFQKDASMPKPGPELFNDDSMVSEIQRSELAGQNILQQQFMDGIDEEDEDTSARRLLKDTITSKGNLVRGKNKSILKGNPHSQPQNSIDKTISHNHTKGNSTIAGQNTKDLINFIDQSKEDPLHQDRQFPIIKPKTGQLTMTNFNFNDKPKSQILEYNRGARNNKVTPIQTSNLTLDYLNQKKTKEENKDIEDDYFQFGSLDTNNANKQRRNSRNPMAQLFHHSSTDKQIKTSSSQQTGKFEPKMNTQGTQSSRHNNKITQDCENMSDQEQSLLLDESVIKKQLHMPNTQAKREQLQKEIGQVIQKEDVRFHDELEALQNDESFYRIMDKDSIEIVNSYYDRCPCLNFRKSLMKTKVYINRGALAIITNGIFESISIMVIVVNSMFLALDDPLAKTPPVYAEYSELIFQVLYTVEMVLKILALGFVINKGSYLRDSWNILDFVIVMSGYVGYLFTGGGANLTVLRSFRVIRPLRTISSIQGLRIIVQALISSLPLLRDTILVLIFFFVIFAIAGVQLFTGELKNRCFNLETGSKDRFDTICAADENCLPSQFCGKSNENPNMGTTSFDNVMYAMLLIFQTVTLEGWTQNMVDLEKAVATWVIVYFVPIVFIGAFFLLNLTLAVIKSKFTEEMRRNKETKNVGKKKILIKKKGVDDDSDIEEQEQFNEDETDEQRDKRIKERIEGLTMQQIEEDPTISPEMRRQIKQKRRLEDLIKKMEIAIKQKEVREKITPRDGTNESARHVRHYRTLNEEGNSSKLTQHSMIFKQQPNYGEIYSNSQSLHKTQFQSQDFTDRIEQVQPQNDYQDKKKPHQKQTTFKVETEQMIKEDAEESQDLTVLLEKDHIPKPKTAGGNQRLNEPNKKLNIHNLQAINGIKKIPRNNSGQYQSVSAWLGQVFELENSRDNSNAPGKVVMSGFAGIANSKLGAASIVKKNDEKNEAKNKEKKAAYEKLQQNFDIFEFLDSEDEFGDDEGSNDERDQSPNNQIVQQMIEDLEIENNNGNFESSNANNVNPLERKSTIATTETKSITKRNTLQRRSSRENFQSKNENQTLADSNVQSLLSQNIELRPPSKNSNRRKSVMPKHQGYKHKPTEEEEEEMKDLSPVSQSSNKSKGRTFKEKALQFLKKSPRGQKAQQKKPLLKKLVKDQQLNETINQFKESMRSSRGSKSQPRPVFGNDLTKSNYSAFGNSKEDDQMSTSLLQRGTVRARSEFKKKKALHKDTVVFNERIQVMKNRRNIYFAEAIRSIGKKKAQLKKEKNEKILKRRFIQLGGGFELPDANSPNYRKNKKKLLRSGSLIKDFQFKEDNFLKLDTEGIINKKATFIDSEFLKEVKEVKEEVKRFDEEEDEVPDMEHVLQMQKKKVALKMKNYKFTSIDDIFEGRENRQNDEVAIKSQNFVAQAGKPPLPKQMGAYNPPVKRTQVKGFQKKVILQPKRFHEDLDDIRDSDDNQDDALKKLEDLYDKNHKSDIYVTGTLSIVFEKPKHENKMMNINYYQHVQHELNQSQIQEQIREEQSQLDNSQMNNSRVHTQNNNIFISAFGEPERLESKESIYDNNMSIGSLGASSVMRSGEVSVRNSSNHKRARSQLKIGLNISRRSGAPNSGALSGRKKHPLRRTASGVSNQNNQSQRRGNSAVVQGSNHRSGQQQHVSGYQVIQRPEVMTDKQILKRLNNNVKQSKVFMSVNFGKLPDQIRRKQGEEPLHIKKKPRKAKKKKNNLKFKEHEEEEEEISDTSQEYDNFNEDFFIDREIDNKEQVNKAIDSAVNRKIDVVEWSGQDIMTRFDPYKTRIALDSLNQIRIWPHGFYGYFKRWRTLLKKIMKGALVENLMTLLVFSNTIILSMDHYGIDPDTQSVLTSFNTFFTIIFAVEMFLKIAAIGIVKWLRDKMNYMDGFIVILSLVELVFMSGSGAFSAFRSIRMLRTLRVLRVARLLRGLKSMINIISVIQRSLSSFVYLGMLLFLFIFIFALLGMQLFGGQFRNIEAQSRYNFDSFSQAFVTSFILLSMENWNQCLFNAMGNDINKGISVIYFIACIFIGNFMLLNLFLAILLDAFTSVDEEDHETAEKKAERERQKLLALKEKEGEDLITGFEEIEGDTMTTGDAKKKKKKKKKKGNNTSRKGSEAQSNILDESMEADLEALEQRKQELSNQKNILFEGIECERSIYIFRQEHKIRIYCYKIEHDNRFENFILVLIILSSVKLIFDTYYFSAPDDDPVVQISSRLDLFFTIMFTGECVMKVIAFGFIQDTNSYLRETWSQMDFFIVVTSLIDATFSGVNIPIIKILRLLRILRPLRFISHNSSMKTVVIALLSSMGAIFNVGIVVVCVFLMFAILGVNLFAGKLQYCSVDKYNISNQRDCFKSRGVWKTYDQNFDNVIQGMLTLFSVATLEGWPDLMYTYTDITGLESGPKRDASPTNAYFFVAFVFMGAFFFMNLFVGVLFMNFEAAQRDEKEALLLEGHEIKWVDMMKMITDAKPEIIKIPKNKISKFMYNFTKAESKFDFFIMICIILNMVQMAMTFEGQTLEYTKGLEFSNYFFTAVFTFECIFKLIGNGSGYFIPGWHKFDFFVVCSSYIDIVMGQLSATSLKFLRVGPQLARVLRVLRVSRLFRLLNKYKGLQALLQTITFSLPSLFNVFALLMLVYFIFAVLSVFMFSQITKGVMIDPIYFNFTNFSQAMIMLLRISTGEDWPLIMYDTMNVSPDCVPGVNCGLSYSPIFFIIFVMIQSYVMLNLFILIILQQFELYYLPSDNILQQFRDDLEKFKVSWAKFSKEFTGIKIRAMDLVQFFRELQGRLSFGNVQEPEILRNIVKMDLESDEDGFIYFNELLYKTMKRIYGTERSRKRILIDIELKILDKLQKIKQKIISSERKSERIKAVTVNPFLAVMYKNMSFKAWVKIFKTNIPKRSDEKEYMLERDSSDEEPDSNRIMQDDDEYEYLTEEDLPCDSDDENFDIDNSQKNLFQERSINALINDVNGITPISPSKLDTKRGNNAESGLNTSNPQTQQIHSNFTDRVKSSQLQRHNLNDDQLLLTPKSNINYQDQQHIDIDDQSLQERSQNGSGFKIKLQQTVQQKLSTNEVEGVSPPVHGKNQNSGGNNSQVKNNQFFNGNSSTHVQSQFGRAAQQQTQRSENQHQPRKSFINENQHKHSSSSSYDEMENKIMEFTDKAQRDANPFDKNATNERLMLNEESSDFDEDQLMDKTPTQRQDFINNNQSKVFNDLQDSKEDDYDSDGDNERNFDTMDHLKQD